MSSLVGVWPCKTPQFDKKICDESETRSNEGEVTSQNLWSRYDRHVVAITWHDVSS